jgi:hypothetical protein
MPNNALLDGNLVIAHVHLQNQHEIKIATPP